MSDTRRKIALSRGRRPPAKVSALAKLTTIAAVPRFGLRHTWFRVLLVVKVPFLKYWTSECSPNHPDRPRLKKQVRIRRKRQECTGAVVHIQGRGVEGSRRARHHREELVVPDSCRKRRSNAQSNTARSCCTVCTHAYTHAPLSQRACRPRLRLLPMEQEQQARTEAITQGRR